MDILRVARWLEHKALHLDFGINDQHGIGNATVMWTYTDRELSVTKRDNSLGLTLGILLEELSSFQCTNPRDHVYGLQGLHQNLRFRSDRGLPAPDYRRPLAEVFRDAARVAIEGVRNLDILGRLHHRPTESEEDATIPSWVPRWHRKWDRRLDVGMLPLVYKSCGNRGEVSLVAQVALDENILSVSGVETGLVAAVFPRLGRLSPGDLVKVLRSIESLNQHPRASAAIALTLTAGQSDKRQSWVESEVTAAYEAWLAYLENTHEWPPDYKDFRHWPADRQAGLHSIVAFDESFYSANLNRCVFVSSHGRCGIGPAQVQVSDIVAVLHGCRWPIVLRPIEQPDEYRVIGVSYVHGVMYGEAVSMFERTRSQDQGDHIFHLR